MGDISNRISTIYSRPSLIRTPRSQNSYSNYINNLLVDIRLSFSSKLSNFTFLLYTAKFFVLYSDIHLVTLPAELSSHSSYNFTQLHNATLHPRLLRTSYIVIIDEI